MFFYLIHDKTGKSIVCCYLCPDACMYLDNQFSIFELSILNSLRLVHLQVFICTRIPNLLDFLRCRISLYWTVSDKNIFIKI